MIRPIDFRTVARARAEREAREARTLARLDALSRWLLGLLAVALAGLALGLAFGLGFWR